MVVDTTKEGIQSMIRVQVRLTEDQARALKDISQQENASIAELTRRAIDQWLQTTDSIPMPEHRHRALAVVGRFRSDQTDISERHDEYLAEICSGQLN
jgi:Ribbon-helix-helix protein, copG family